MRSMMSGKKTRALLLASFCGLATVSCCHLEVSSLATEQAAPSTSAWAEASEAEIRPPRDSDWSPWNALEPIVRKAEGAGIVGYWDQRDLYPSVLWIAEQKSTAVAVGPRVVMTAAHNVWNQRTIEVLGILADCDLPEEYDHESGGDSDKPDLALCKTRAHLPLRKYDHVTLDPAAISNAENVSVAGYGCVMCKGEPNGDLGLSPGVSISHPVADYAFRLDICYCPGDSGGPVYVGTGSNRRVVGISSGGKCFLTASCDLKCGEDPESCGRATSTAKMADFIRQWAKGTKYRGGQTGTEPLLICGLDDPPICA